MITCLKDFIGLKDVNENPESGLLINDLEGITTTQMEAVDNSNHYDVNETWNEIQERAIRLFEHDVRNKSSHVFKNYSLKNTVNTGEIEDFTLMPKEPKFSGIYFDLDYYYQNTKLKINSVWFNLETAATFDIIIADAANGNEIERINVEGKQGINEIKILKEYATYKYQKIFIGYEKNLDISEVDTWETAEIESVEFGESQAPYYKSFTSAYTGIGVIYSIDCSIDNLVCQRLETFTVPFWYLLGIQFVKEKINSDRINRFTMLDTEQAKMLRAEFEKQYNDSLNSAMRDLNFPEDNQCFICNRVVNKRKMLP